MNIDRISLPIASGSRRNTMRGRSLIWAITLLLSASPAFAMTCKDLTAFRFPDATITIAELVTGGTVTVATEKGPLIGLPPFCRIAVSIKPTHDSDIRFEVWMPESGWNGRIRGTGNGYLGGQIAYGYLADGIKHGYVATNSDMGMTKPAGEDASIFANQPDRWIDWGYRATHLMTVFTKQIAARYYGQAAKKSYFIGCSTGGEQSLMEAERFPDDYDGIVAGAPANDRVNLTVDFLWNFAVSHATPDSYLPPEKLAMVNEAVIDACDQLDGVKDGLIEDPRACNFDPGALQCKGKDQDDCLNESQVKTVREIYSGPMDPRTGQNIYPGFSKGSEMGWSEFSVQSPPSKVPLFSPVFQWIFGLAWDWRRFDYDHDVDTMTRRLARDLNANSGDLDTFWAHGHKLLVYHGWADSEVPSTGSIDYYNAIMERYGKQGAGKRPAASRAVSNPESVDSFYRLFMIPGMGHCGGGPGPGSFDSLAAVQQWVEQGIAPDTIVASKMRPSENGGTAKIQRLLCPYPKVARYNGPGSIDEASSYTCKNSKPVTSKATSNE